MEQKKKFQPALFLIAIGIVYGDIGTSPLYVMKSILAGNGGIGQVNEPFIIGSLSLVIWTVTLLTTIKYVLIAMKADNHGEGGIFSLYALVRKYGKWLILPAMLESNESGSGILGVLYAAPISDVVAVCVILALTVSFFRQVKKQERLETL